MNTEIIFATNNLGKLKEVRNIFSDTKFKIIGLKEVGYNDEIEETGNTFEANALLKAETIFSKLKLPVIADDSGLCVNQLNCEPGVYSARYAGDKASYLDNNLKLLSELKNFRGPHFAKFICTSVYLDKDHKIITVGGLFGKIINVFRGENGFGFDPIFVPRGYSKTLAELDLNEKNSISHRAKAFTALKIKMKKLKLIYFILILTPVIN